MGANPLVPEDFPNKGKYRLYNKSWDHVGYSDTPTHPGQQPIRYPEDWLPLECFLGYEIRKD